MAGTFACPECGGELALHGATPGREVQCAQCATWDEVPYLPRGGVWTRPRFRRRRAAWVIPLAWAGVVLLAVFVAFFAWSRATASRQRATRDATLDTLVASADAAEKAGRPERALSEIEAALSLLRPDDPACAGRLGELSARRDALSAREGESRIASASMAEPDAAVGDLLSLQARAHKDRALEPLVPALLRAIQAARRRQADAALDAARRAVDAGRPLDALVAGERALGVADKLEGDASRAVAAGAEGLMDPILARIGVVVVQLPGKFTLGSTASYDTSLGPIVADSLRRRGYAPRPATGPARPLWDRRAALRLEFQVVETHGVLYLQSQNRLTQVVTSVTLLRGSELIWHDTVTARTEVPLPNLPVHAAGRLAFSGRDLDMEHRLYENARLAALDRVGSHLRALPEP